MEKKRKPVHFTLTEHRNGRRVSDCNGPVCDEPLHPYTTVLMSYYREDVTCEKCKNTAQFIISNFNRRFGIK